MNLNIIKIIFLIVAVFFTLVNTSRAANKQSVPFVNFATQTIGIVGFIVLQFNLL